MPASGMITPAGNPGRFRYSKNTTTKIAIAPYLSLIHISPNEAARELIEDEALKNSQIAFPDLSQYSNLETFTYLGEEGDALYNEMWKEVKSN